jgi:hypothetical protein
VATDSFTPLDAGLVPEAPLVETSPPTEGSAGVSSDVVAPGDAGLIADAAVVELAPAPETPEGEADPAQSEEVDGDAKRALHTLVITVTEAKDQSGNAIELVEVRG